MDVTRAYWQQTAILRHATRGFVFVPASDVTGSDTHATGKVTHAANTATLATEPGTRVEETATQLEDKSTRVLRAATRLAETTKGVAALITHDSLKISRDIFKITRVFFTGRRFAGASCSKKPIFSHFKALFSYLAPLTCPKAKKRVFEGVFSSYKDSISSRDGIFN